MSRDAFVNRDARHGTSSHRRSKKQEKELAKRSGGRLVPGSGCGRQKGDVMKAFGGIFRLEAKTTKHNSFSVTRDMVGKIEDAALLNGEMPAIVIEFLGETGKPELEVAVLPIYVLEIIGGIYATGKKGT